MADQGRVGINVNCLIRTSSGVMVPPSPRTLGRGQGNYRDDKIIWGTSRWRKQGFLSRFFLSESASRAFNQDACGTEGHPHNRPSGHVHRRHYTSIFGAFMVSRSRTGGSETYDPPFTRR